MDHNAAQIEPADLARFSWSKTLADLDFQALLG